MTNEWLSQIQKIQFSFPSDDTLCDALEMFLFFMIGEGTLDAFSHHSNAFEGIQVELECGKVLIWNQFWTIFSNETVGFMFGGLQSAIPLSESLESFRKMFCE